MLSSFWGGHISPETEARPETPSNEAARTIGLPVYEIATVQEEQTARLVEQEPQDKFGFSDQIELIRRRLTDEVRDSVEKELKRRYSWIGIVAIVLTSGGLVLWVKNALFDARVKLESAQEVQKAATLKVSKAAESADQIQQRVIDVETKATEASNSINRTIRQAAAVRKDLSEISTANLGVSEKLRSDFDALTGVVNTLVATQPQLGKQITELRNSTMSIKADIDMHRTRAELAKYDVVIFPFRSALELSEELRREGFSTRFADFAIMGESATATRNHANISFPADMPVEIAFQIFNACQKHSYFEKPIRALTIGHLSETILIRISEELVGGVTVYGSEKINSLDDFEDFWERLLEEARPVDYDDT
jgi:hypothetical protein